MRFSRKKKNIKSGMDYEEKLKLCGLKGLQPTWNAKAGGPEEDMGQRDERKPHEAGLVERKRILKVTPKGGLLPTRCNVSATLEGF